MNESLLSAFDVLMPIVDDDEAIGEGGCERVRGIALGEAGDWDWEGEIDVGRHEGGCSIVVVVGLDSLEEVTV